MDIEQLTEFFKWMTIINMGLLVFSSIAVVALKPIMLKMNAKMFGINESRISELVYAYLGNLKALVIVFNITPYISLLLMK